MARLIDITGKAVSGEWGTDDLDGSGIPVLRTTNFTNTGDVSYANVVTRSISKKNIANKFLRKGDIIIEKSGGSDKQPVGRVIYFEGEENKYLFNNFTGLLRVVNSQKWHSKYVFYSLYANYQKGGTRAFENKTTGLHNLKLDNYLNAVEIRNISYEIQEQRSVELDKLRKVINLRLAQLAKLDELVKCRFVELFGDPILNEKKWMTKPVKELTTKVGSGATPKGGDSSYKDSGISLIRSLNVHNNIFTTKELAHIDNEQANQLSNVTIQSGDVLLNITGASVARCCIVPDDILPARVNQHVCIIRCNDMLNPLFLERLLTSDNYQTYLWNVAEGGGGTRQALTKQQIENFSIITPPITLQTTFAAFVQRIDKLRFVIQKSLDETQTLFNSLMQQYFD